MFTKILPVEKLNNLPLIDCINKLEEVVIDVPTDESESSYRYSKEILSYLEERMRKEKSNLPQIDTDIFDLIKSVSIDLKEDYKYRNSKRRRIETISEFKTDFEDIAARIKEIIK